jgi:hypothetical protein
MKAQKIEEVLKEMKIGMSSVKWGIVVTRCSKNSFEVGTYGKKENVYDLAKTVQVILSSINNS